MRRSKTTRSRPRTSIMELSYKTHNDLSEILDPSGAYDWKSLVSLMPTYTAKDVKMIETEGIKPGRSCTMQLLQDMDSRGYNVHGLREILKISGNEKALKCLLNGLKDKASIHEDTKTGRKRKRLIRPTLALDDPLIADTKTGEKGLTSPDVGTRGTLTMEHTIHQPTAETDLGSPMPETRGTLTMEHTIHQPTAETGQQPSRQPTLSETGLTSLNEGIRETARMDSTTHQHEAEMIQLHFPIQDTAGLTKEIHKRRHIENLPSENDESQYQNAGGHKRSMHCFSTLDCQRLLTEHEDSKQESVITCSPAPLGMGQFFMWIMSCGSQGKTV